MQLLNIDNNLFVDSRHVAFALRVLHKSLFEVLEEYRTTLEQAFGLVRFETDQVELPNGGYREIVYALLNKDQATFLILLMPNSHKVIKAKVSLVKAFSESERLLADTQNTLSLN